MKTIELNPSIKFSNQLPLTLMGGMNVLETIDLALQTASKLKEIADKLNIPYIFKASFDKANRSSIKSYRGPGLEEGLRMLEKVKSEVGCPIVTDIHENHQAAPVAEVADVLGIPAFLCRQTDLLEAASKTGKILNIKKMQMMAPWDVRNILNKLEEMNHTQTLLCERGTTFGYNNLVVDPLSFPLLKETGYPVVFDVTHALQQPGGLGGSTAGRGQYVAQLAMAGLSQGISGLYLETHIDPSKAKCDGPCALPLDEAEKFLTKMKRYDDFVKDLL